MKIFNEQLTSTLEGTIIDIESIGDFNNSHPDHDSRQYIDIIPVIFGTINNKEITILYASEEKEIEELKHNIKQIIDRLNKPFHAFNTRYETGVLFHSCGITTQFEREINAFPREKKKFTVENLGIPNYEDPFYDDGNQCRLTWLSGKENIEQCIKHNRSCLLKERDILLLRGHRKPDKLELNSV